MTIIELKKPRRKEIIKHILLHIRKMKQMNSKACLSDHCLPN
jgi:hypothetical protein